MTTEIKLTNPRNDAEAMTSVIEAYEAETAVDQTITIRRRMETLGAIVVTDENVDEAKRIRTALNAMLKDASAPRLRVQRAIKAHPIGKWAFTKSEVENEIEQKSAHLKMEIDAHTKSEETIALATERKDWVLIVKGVDLATMNRLVADLLDKRILAENRGPFCEEPCVQQSDKAVKEAQKLFEENV